MSIYSIVAHDEDNVIGAENKLLWRIPTDMNFFKETTLNNAVAMGLNTWDSIPAKYKPLEERLNIVLSRKPGLTLGPKVFIARSLIDALHIADTQREYKDKHLYLCGGQKVYEDGLVISDELLITLVHTKIDVSGLKDVKYYPKINSNQWELISDSGKIFDEKSGLWISFLRYKRIW